MTAAQACGTCTLSVRMNRARATVPASLFSCGLLQSRSWISLKTWPRMLRTCLDMVTPQRDIARTGGITFPPEGGTGLRHWKNSMPTEVACLLLRIAVCRAVTYHFREFFRSPARAPARTFSRGTKRLFPGLLRYLTVPARREGTMKRRVRPN